MIKKQIKDLESGDTDVLITKAEVISAGKEKPVSTRWGPAVLKEFMIKDETGEVKLVLWGDLVNKCRVGDEIKISGAKVVEFRDELQVSVPRKGRINVKGVEMKEKWD